MLSARALRGLFTPDTGQIGANGQGPPFIVALSGGMLKLLKKLGVALESNMPILGKSRMNDRAQLRKKDWSAHGRKTT